MPVHTLIAPLAAVLAILLAIPSAGSAQTASPPWAPELSAAVGVGHVFRFEDESFGTEPNISVATAIRHSSGWAFEAEANHTFGLTPTPAPCGVYIDGVPVACTGSARSGVLQASSVSFNVRYLIARRRVQPYLMAGLGVLHTRSLSSVTTVRGGEAFQHDFEKSDTGLGPDLGAGLRVPLTRHASINPEVRWLEGAILGRENLAVTRLSVRAAYSW